METPNLAMRCSLEKEDDHEFMCGPLDSTSCMRVDVGRTTSGSTECGEENKACSLVTLSEIEAAIGSSVTLNQSPALPGGKGEFCVGIWSGGSLMLRLASGLDPGRDRSGAKEKAGIEMMKNMGAQVDVKTFGPIVCSTLVPPSGKEQMGYNTTCTVSKDTAVAGIEVTAKNKEGMVPIEKLHPLAEKMAGRF